MRLAVLALPFVLAGCMSAAVGLGAAGGAAQVPMWLTTAQDVVTGVKTLTEAEQLACELQTLANQRGDSSASIAAGYFCKW